MSVSTSKGSASTTPSPKDGSLTRDWSSEARLFFLIRPAGLGWEVAFGDRSETIIYGDRDEAIAAAMDAARRHWDRRGELSGAAHAGALRAVGSAVQPVNQILTSPSLCRKYLPDQSPAWAARTQRFRRALPSLVDEGKDPPGRWVVAGLAACCGLLSQVARRCEAMTKPPAPKRPAPASRGFFIGTS